MTRVNVAALVAAMLPIVAAVTLAGAYAADSGGAPSSVSKDDSASSRARARDLRAVLDELDAERRHIEKLEAEVRELQKANAQLAQRQSDVQAADAKLQRDSSDTRRKLGAVEKTVSNLIGPLGFGDRINAFLGGHTFSMFGSVGAGFYFDRQNGQSQPALHLELGPMIKLAEWLNFVGIVSADLEPGGTSDVSPDLMNFEIFPFGREYPIELVAGLADMPFGHWYENVGPLWINPFVSAPLLYSAEAVVPPKTIGLQARGGIQWGDIGQDADYTVWIDSGPSFESAPGVSSVPAPVIGEALNELSGVNLATKGKGIGARFRFYPIPVDSGLGRLELMATTYNDKWLDSNWYHAWGSLGLSSRAVPFARRMGAELSRDAEPLWRGGLSPVLRA